MTGSWWQVWHGPRWLRINERIKYVYSFFSHTSLHIGNSISVQVNEVIVNVILALCPFSLLLERQPAAPWKSQIALFFMHRQGRLPMKHLASFASLGELKNDAVFYSWGNIISRTMVIKIDATRCQILRLKCIKLFIGWGSAPVTAGGALPQTL